MGVKCWCGSRRREDRRLGLNRQVKRVDLFCMRINEMPNARAEFPVVEKEVNEGIRERVLRWSSHIEIRDNKRTVKMICKGGGCYTGNRSVGQP